MAVSYANLVKEKVTGDNAKINCTEPLNLVSITTEDVREQFRVISSPVPKVQRSLAFLTDANDMPTRSKLQEHEAKASYFIDAYASVHSTHEQAIADDKLSLGGHLVFVKTFKKETAIIPAITMRPNVTIATATARVSRSNRAPYESFSL